MPAAPAAAAVAAAPAAPTYHEWADDDFEYIGSLAVDYGM